MSPPRGPGRRTARDDDDLRFMRIALLEARSTIGRTSPNPPVGAVVVKDGRVVATGRTSPAGGPHAEIVALRRAGARAVGSTLYVTLEPCCHHGKTGPCTSEISAARVDRVVVGCQDRNPLVSGKGVASLRGAGVEVVEGVLAEDCLELALPFFVWVEQGRPFVVLKAAVTLDGRIAAPGGDSKWITGEAARARVHEWRDRFDAILVGAGTVMADDPALTTRGREGGRDPARIILDGELATDPGARVYRQDSAAPTLLVTSAEADHRRLAAYTASGAEPLVLPASGGRVDIGALLKALASRGIVSVLVEGGARVHGAFAASGLVDEIRLFVAPKLLGGGLPWLALPDDQIPRKMGEAMRAGPLRVEPVGEDLLLRTRMFSAPDASH